LKDKDEQKKTDPLLVAFLDKHTIRSAVSRAGIFRPDDANVLKGALCGVKFSQAQIQCVERWILKHDPYQGGGVSVRDRLLAFDKFVDSEITKCGIAAWLVGAVREFEECVRILQRQFSADIVLPLVRAVFVAFLTVKALD
jgi:hypothetical protein